MESYLQKANLLDPQCASRIALEIISDKWTSLVIYVLSSGTKRYNELRREIQPISHKMLTQTLRNLEQHGLVKRVVYPVVPPMVEYSLTPLGESLLTALVGLWKWVEENYHSFMQAKAS